MIRRLWDAFAFAWETRPYAFTFAVVFTYVGLAEIVWGDDVSVALSFLDVPIISRVMGVFLFVGGLLTLAGFARRDMTLELLGMALFGAGIGIYAVAALAGFGQQGTVSGGLGLAVAVGTLRRVQTMLHLADDRLSTDGVTGPRVRRACARRARHTGPPDPQ